MSCFHLLLFVWRSHHWNCKSSDFMSATPCQRLTLSRNASPSASVCPHYSSCPQPRVPFDFNFISLLASATNTLLCWIPLHLMKQSQDPFLVKISPALLILVSSCNQREFLQLFLKCKIMFGHRWHGQWVWGTVSKHAGKTGKTAGCV